MADLPKTESVDRSSHSGVATHNNRDIKGSCCGREFSLWNNKGKVLIAFMIAAGLSVGIYFLVQHVKSQNTSIQQNTPAAPQANLSTQPMLQPQPAPQPLPLKNVKHFAMNAIDQTPAPVPVEPMPVPTQPVPAPAEPTIPTDPAPGTVQPTQLSTGMIVVIVVVTVVVSLALRGCCCICR